jgi:hypothetical protein
MGTTFDRDGFDRYMNSGRVVVMVVVLVLVLVLSFSGIIVVVDAVVAVVTDGVSGSCSIGFFPDTIFAQHRALEDMYSFLTI